MNAEELFEDVVLHATTHYVDLEDIAPDDREPVRFTLRRWLAGVQELIDLAGDRLGIAEVGLWCPVRGCEAVVRSPGGVSE